MVIQKTDEGSSSPSREDDAQMDSKEAEEMEHSQSTGIREQNRGITSGIGEGKQMESLPENILPDLNATPTGKEIIIAQNRHEKEK
ncbi:hypothetical protein R1flu_023681 [Riccia fluitans]|uniref:Uncharacterized protein n=1 Tax=Riccia fluitans TaxID=41844 RepID=A0ABD1XSQ7_9MARC